MRWKFSNQNSIVRTALTLLCAFSIVGSCSSVNASSTSGSKNSKADTASIGVILDVTGAWTCTRKGKTSAVNKGDDIFPGSVFKRTSEMGTLIGLVKKQGRFTLRGEQGRDQPLPTKTPVSELDRWVQDFAQLLSNNRGDWIIPLGRSPDAHHWLKECVIVSDADAPDIKECLTNVPRFEYALSSQPSALQKRMTVTGVRVFDVTLTRAVGAGPAEVKDKSLVLVVPSSSSQLKQGFDRVAAQVQSWSDLKVADRQAMLQAALIGIGSGQLK